MRAQLGTRAVVLLAAVLTVIRADVVEFLIRYGYLPPSDPKSGNLRSESDLRSAVAEMQRFGGLTPTGRLDPDTVRLMSARRCGVPDLLSVDRRRRIRRYAIQGQKWPSTDLTWSVRTEGSGAVLGPLRRAFSVWSSASALTFSQVSVGGDIAVSFLQGPHGDGYPFDGEGAVLAHAFFPGEGIGGDAHFDADERWMHQDGVNLFAVAAHEIGHSLGLSHSSTPGSLMFPYYQTLDDHFTLPSDDADGIRHLYGGVEPKSDEASTSAPTVPQVTIPDICNSSVDAISVIRREVFVFKGRHFWRLHDNRTVRSGYPVSMDRFWSDLPSDVDRIDALYERPTDTKIVFFSGRRHWLFSANQLEPGYPKPLTDLGLPEEVERVDAALVWGHNGKTYLFSGARYWKMDEQEGKVELDYPRSITAWRGLPAPLDAAFQWTDGSSYFFQKSKFWRFVDAKMRVASASEIGGFWFGCPSQNTNPPSSAPTLTACALYWLLLAHCWQRVARNLFF